MVTAVLMPQAVMLMGCAAAPAQAAASSSMLQLVTCRGLLLLPHLASRLTSALRRQQPAPQL